MIWEDTVGMPDAQTWKGHDGVRAAFEQFLSAWEDFVIEPLEFTDAGESIVVRHRITARGKSAGIPMDAVMTNVFTVRDGKITRRRSFGDHVEGLKAVGLSE